MKGAKSTKKADSKYDFIYHFFVGSYRFSSVKIHQCISLALQLYVVFYNVCFGFDLGSQ